MAAQQSQRGSDPYNLDGVIQLSAFFNGVEFPFTKQSLLGFVHMSESSKLAIPMLRMQVSDGIGFLRNNPNALVEGAQVALTVTARGLDTYSRTFRVNSMHIEQTQSAGEQIDFDGYLDYPKFWIETTANHYPNSTSSQVLRAYATYCGLQFAGDETNDAQQWHGGLKRIHRFCGDIANHGYVDDASCMKLAVTLDGSMRYRNVATLDVASPVATFSIGSIAAGKIPVVSHKPRNTGGASNRRSGYRQTMLEYSTMRSDLYRMHTNMQVNVDEGGAVNLNPGVRSSVVSGFQLASPIDYGNVGDNYHRAFYQNRRGTGLFNVGLDIVTPLPTVTNPGISIFDTVTVEAPQEFLEQSGSHVVVSHAIAIDPSSYNEKFELTRRSAASTQSTSGANNTANYDSANTALYTDS